MPVLIVWLIVMSWGFTLLVTALGRRFRDAVALAPARRCRIFFTPVGYPLSAAGSFAKVLAFNPVSGVIETWRWSLFESRRTVSPSRSGSARPSSRRCGWYVFGRMETASRTMSEWNGGIHGPTSRSAAKGWARATASVRSSASSTRSTLSCAAARTGPGLGPLGRQLRGASRRGLRDRRHQRVGKVDPDPGDVRDRDAGHRENRGLGAAVPATRGRRRGPPRADRPREVDLLGTILGSPPVRSGPKWAGSRSSRGRAPPRHPR